MAKRPRGIKNPDLGRRHVPEFVCAARIRGSASFSEIGIKNTFEGRFQGVQRRTARRFAPSQKPSFSSDAFRETPAAE